MRWPRRDPWRSIPEGQRDEIAIALDHRLGEAEDGNAYVYFDETGAALVSLFEHHPELMPAGETVGDVWARVRALERRWQ